MLCPRNLAQLFGHGKTFGRLNLRLIGQKYLRLGFALGLYRRLNRQASLMLLGNMFDRSVLRFLRLRGSAAFQGEDHLANFDLGAFLDLDFLDRARHRRRNFHHRLVSFQFHHRLAFGNFRARRNHQPHQIALIDVLSQFRQPEFSRATGCGR